MTANPEITNVIATQSGGTVRCLIAIRNYLSTEGMVQTSIKGYSGGICLDAAYKVLYNCISPSVSTYISGVQWMLIGVFTPSTMPSALCVATYQCISGENCPSQLCTTYNSTPYWSKINVYVDYGLGVIPNAVTNTSVTSADRNLVFRWTPPDNAPVTYYGITLYQETTSLQSGYIIYNSSGGLSVSNLQNDVEYRLEVYGLSDDGRVGSLVSITGIPASSCITPACNFNLT